MEVEIIKAIQKGATPLLDEIFRIITLIGEEFIFISIFLLFYWCISYNYAFKFAFFYSISFLINNVLKLIINRPRPFMASYLIENKFPVAGLSFPSGHAQGIAVISTFCTYDAFKNKQIKKRNTILITVFFTILTLLISYSRMYLGQHYLSDVLAGLFLGIVIVVILKKIFNTTKKIEYNIEFILSVISIFVLSLIILLCFNTFDLSYTKLYLIFKYSGMFLGACFGFILIKIMGVAIESGRLAKSIKTIAGLPFVFTTYYFLSLLSFSYFSEFLTTCVVAFVATFVYPLIFNIFYKKV